MLEIEKSSIKDRGMKKWQGLILSEHQEVLGEIASQSASVYMPPLQMDIDLIGETLNRAFANRHKCRVVVNQVDANGIYNEVEGYVKGFDGDYIIVDTNRVNLDLVRFIERVDAFKFWESDDHD